MKKIAYFYRVDKWGTYERFLDEAREMGIELVPIKYKELSMRQDEKGVAIFFGERDLSEFDLFYFRAVGKELEWSKILSDYAKSKNIPVVDEYLSTDGALRRFKSVGGMKMVVQGVSYPATWYVGKYEEAVERSREIGLPVVIKMSEGGRHGLSTFWIREEKDFEEMKTKVLDEKGKTKRGYLVQEYIPNDGDYRLMVVGYKTLGGFKRAPKEVKLVMNKSIGKSKGLDEIPADVAMEAEKAARALGIEVTGVDLVVDQRTGKAVVIEANEAPQFTVFEKRSGKNAAKAIIEYLVSKAR